MRLVCVKPGCRVQGDGLARELAAFYVRLAASQVDMPAEAARIFREHLWDLY